MVDTEQLVPDSPLLVAGPLQQIDEWLAKGHTAAVKGICGGTRVRRCPQEQSTGEGQDRLQCKLALLTGSRGNPTHGVLQEFCDVSDVDFAPLKDIGAQPGIVGGVELIRDVTRLHLRVLELLAKL
eukprot:COSAG05_NODE_1969_length_3768_cov_5.081221_1_plen_126_part_00